MIYLLIKGDLEARGEFGTGIVGF